MYDLCDNKQDRKGLPAYFLIYAMVMGVSN